MRYMRAYTHACMQVLCASTEAAVEPLTVPEGVPNGERVMVVGFDGEAEAQLNPKRKILETLLPDMLTSAGASCHVNMRLLKQRCTVCAALGCWKTALGAQKCVWVPRTALGCWRSALGC
jgi:hypothetical protein